MARCLLLPLLALQQQSASTTSSERCATALDCGLNGACVAGACVCDKPWTGATCSSLALSKASRAGYHVPGTIYFSFRSASNTPSTMIGAVHGSRPGDQIYPRARFGVEDLAIYIVSHFESVIDISPYTDGVRIQRIRLRANMFFVRHAC